MENNKIYKKIAISINLFILIIPIAPMIITNITYIAIVVTILTLSFLFLINYIWFVIKSIGTIEKNEKAEKIANSAIYTGAIYLVLFLTIILLAILEENDIVYYNEYINDFIDYYLNISPFITLSFMLILSIRSLLLYKTSRGILIFGLSSLFLALYIGAFYILSHVRIGF